MDISWILLGGIFLFFIIYFAVGLAIKPLMYEPEEILTDKQELGLVKLRDIDVLTPLEFDEVIELYRKKGSKKQSEEECEKYAKVLIELKESGYFTEEEFLFKLNKLKKFFNIMT